MTKFKNWKVKNENLFKNSACQKIFPAEFIKCQNMFCPRGERSFFKGKDRLNNWVFETLLDTLVWQGENWKSFPELNGPLCKKFLISMSTKLIYNVKDLFKVHCRASQKNTFWNVQFSATFLKKVVSAYSQKTVVL